MIAMAAYLPTQTRAQSGPADSEEALVIPVHSSTPTTVQVRAVIVDAWIRHDGEFLMEIVGQNINLRPQPDTPVGTEAVIVVETSTARRRFRLRVVERREDAIRKLELPAVNPVEPTERTGEASRETPPVAPVNSQATASPPESAPTPTAPAALQPRASDELAPEFKPEPAREHAEPVTERAAPAAAARAFDLSVHALVSLGVTAHGVPAGEPITARQPHGSLGLRLTLSPQDTWWAIEAGISAERLAGSMVFARGNNPDFRVSGPWFRAELGIRAAIGTRWIPSVYAGLGMLAHIRTTENEFDARPGSVETMVPGAVLALGTGLQYRTGDVLLGLEFQARYGGPDDYLSIAALWTVGCFLDLGDEP